MARRAHRMGVAAGLVALTGCSLLTNLDGYSGGATGSSDAGPDDVLVVEGSSDGPSSGEPDACATFDAGVNPALLSDAVAIAVGSAFSCALRADGTVVCWGDNSAGQLGVAGVGGSTRPVTVTALSGVTAITAGEEFACAIDASQNVWCWGANGRGQIGTGGTDQDSHLPERVVAPGGGPLGGVTAIKGGTGHACAATGSQLVCWGSNTAGQLGRSAAGPAIGVVDGVTNVLELATSGDYTCAVADDVTPAQPKAVFCWGSNSDDQLAYTGGDTATPQRVATKLGTPGAHPLTAGGWGHVCARDDRDTLICWGEDDFGQLGDGLQPGPPTPTPRAVPGLGAVRMAALGDDYTCAIRSDSTVACLGVNDRAQLGNGSADPVPEGGGPPPHVTPTSVSNLGAVDRLSAFDAHTCAILAHPCMAGGPVVCWGQNGDGQLGDGTRAPRLVPVAVRAP